MPKNLYIKALRWLAICLAVGAMAGTASALLLWSLQVATDMREAHRWLIWLLAPAGLCVGLMYHYLGRRVEKGNNLLLEEIHEPRGVIPARMTPLVLIGTFLTHLFGGSAGREGTALQTGASLADQLTRPLRLGAVERRILLMAGISGGFASVFGTPVAGAVFGMEVLYVGLGFEAAMWKAVAPCFATAFAADSMTRAWHIHHTVYAVAAVPEISVGGLVSAVAAGVAFGVVARGFAAATHELSSVAKRTIAYAPLRPFVGGLIVTAGVMALGTTRYIGLGVPTIVAAFHGALPVYDWAGKFVFTVVTLGAGFKGGEVTPLFFIGATLGNAMARVLWLPSSLLAGMGFAGVFAGAANTPVASTLMAMELFGPKVGVYAAVGCFVSWVCSGEAGIYRAQRRRGVRAPAGDHVPG